MERPTGSRERTLDEVKAEVLRRAGRVNPVETIRPADAEAVMTALRASIAITGPKSGARSGSATRPAPTSAPRPARRATSSENSTCKASTPAASAAIRRRRRPGQLAAYQHSLRIFRKAAPLCEPALKIVELPFEGQDAGRASPASSGRRRSRRS